VTVATSSSPQVVIRALRDEDLPSVATRQSTELPEGFFSQLGTRFLRRYLETYVHSPLAVALIAELDDVPVGHLVGTVRPGHYQWALRARWRRLLPSWLIALSTHPRALLQFLRTRVGRYARAAVRAVRSRVRAVPREPSIPVPRAAGPAALLHVAVDPEARGAGVGAALVREFETQARRAGCTTARLVTFADARPFGTDAGSFYERLGWHRRDHRVDDAGRTVLVYERAL
jgi:GNAT superfamily N-acetyltransferase